MISHQINCDGSWFKILWLLLYFELEVILRSCFTYLNPDLFNFFPAYKLFLGFSVHKGMFYTINRGLGLYEANWNDLTVVVTLYFIEIIFLNMPKSNSIYLLLTKSNSIFLLLIAPVFKFQLFTNWFMLKVLNLIQSILLMIEYIVYFILKWIKLTS